MGPRRWTHGAKRLFQTFCWMVCLCVTNAGARIAQGSECGVIPPRGFGSGGAESFHGAHVNEEYCYSLTIPEGLTGYGDTRGFGIALPPDHQGYIYVGSESNSWDAVSAQGEAKTRLAAAKRSGKIVLASRTVPTTLGDLPASRLVLRYSCKENGPVYVDDSIVALSPKNGIVYELVLQTPEVAYEANKALLSGMAKDWRTRPPRSNSGCQ